MTKQIIKIVLLTCALFTTKGNAQEETLGLLVKYDNEEVKLKIIPKKAYYWLQGLQHGYIISRRELGESEYAPIHGGLLKPSEKSIWLHTVRGQEMYDFHNASVLKIKDMIENGGGDFLTSFQQLQRADENYKLYIMITMRDKSFGDLVGLEYIDKSADPEKKYEYKVEMKNSDWESKPIIFSSMGEYTTPNLNALSQDKSIRLSWVHNENLPLFGYHIEKSETGLNYDRITEAPIWPTNENFDDTLDLKRVFEVWHQDSLTTNYQPFYYRLTAVDAWGDEWSPSNVVVEMGRDLTPPRVENPKVEVDSINRKFIISWEASPDTDVKSYFITRANKVKGRDTIVVQGISPTAELKYVFENPIEMKNYYFKIGAIDTSGNYAITDPVGAFINDITPPTLSDGISFEVDSSGIVSLSWGEMKDPNPEGYWVFKSFNPEKDFMKITDTVHHHNSLVDSNSLSLLNHQVFYYVTALDKSFNESLPSPVIEVDLPDTIPPSATSISSVIANENRLTIKWDKNQSEDVRSYMLYKKIDRDDWKLVGTVPSTSQEFTYDEQYTGDIDFKILAIDESDNISKLEYTYSHSPSENEVEKFDIDISKSETEISISWNAIGTKYKLYKGSNQAFKFLKYLDTNSYTLAMDALEPDDEFYIKAYNKEGRLTSISQIKKI